ncbi:uncharacterized protein [Choristoneura fumiferana]|uniref:uncharacterized protein n=1 Tax=Choristoneura fumiferana TaxID=7141 RepID=UPI003D15434A
MGLSLFIMRRLWYVLFCVFLIQRVAGQPMCKPDLYISIDDLLRALSSGQINVQGNPIGQDVCGIQQDVSPDAYGSQQNLISTELFPISNQPVSYGNQISFQPSFQVDQSGCGYQQPSISLPSLPTGSQSCGCPSISLNQPCGCNIQQPSISFSGQPSFSMGSQSFESQPSISLNKPCGNIQQPSFSFFSQPSFSIGSQSSESQPSISLNQPFTCSIQQPSFSFPSQPGLSIGSQSCGCQPSISLNQQYECNSQPSNSFTSQPSISLGSSSLNQQSGCGQPNLSNNLRGYQTSLTQNQQPSVSYSQPISLQSPCGTQQSFSTNRPSLTLRETNNQPSSSVPSLSLNSLSSSCQRAQSQVSSNQCNSQKQSQSGNVGTGSVANVSNNVISVVPNALLQAPPFGIFFDGDHLIIDGAVQICGTMPFNSAVRVSGVLPASGVGNVQYVCEDVC